MAHTLQYTQSSMRVTPLLHLQTALLRPFTSMSASPSTSSDTAAHAPRLSSKLPQLADDGSRRIFLIRHGETDWNALGKMQGGGFDLELNENGRLQAQKLSEELADIPLDLVASSHLQRAQKTADKVHERHSSARRIVKPGLGEMRFGEFEGLSLKGPECTKEITEKFLHYNNEMKENKDVTWPGGESLADVEVRSISALNEILNENAESRYIGIVGHGRTINIMLASLLEQDCRAFSKFRQRNCSINVMDVSPNLEYKGLLLNYYDHIER